MSIFFWQRNSKLASRNGKAKTSRRGARLLLETLEDRCLMSISNFQALPLTLTEGATSSNVSVATFVSLDSPAAFMAPGGGAVVTFPTGATTVASPPATVSVIGVEFLPGVGNVDEYAVTVSSITAGQATGPNPLQYVVGVVDGADSSGASAFSTLSVTEAPLVLGAVVPPTTVAEGFTVPGNAQLLDFTGSQFATPSDFKVTIDWGDGSPVASGMVGQFAPGDLFVQAQNSHTYTTPGTDTIVVTVQDLEVGGSTLAADIGPITVTDAALTAGTAPAVIATEGAPLNNAVVGQFTDADALAQPSDFAASVTNWGDGQTSPATVVETSVDGSGAHFVVQASHIYTDPLAAGSISVTIQDLTGTATVTGTTAVTVNAGALQVTATPLTLTEAATIPAGTAVGSFTDLGGADPLANYAGSFVSFPGADATTPLTLTQNGNSFTLATAAATTFTGSGGVSQSGTYTLSISDAGGNTATTTATINVTDAPLTLGSVAAASALTEGTPLSATTQLVAFTDGNLSAAPSDYKVTIDWGDGSPVASGMVGQVSAGSFFVEGGHTYTKPQTATPVVTIQDTAVGGSTLAADIGPITVTDAALTAGTAPAVIATEGAPLNNAVVGQFTDADALAQPSDFAASVTNWGDGSTGTGTVVETSVDGGGAHFDVVASHTYTAPLAAGSISVTIQDLTGTAAVTGTTAVTVNAGALQVTATPLTLTEAATIPAGTAVGSFTDLGGADPLANYAGSFVSFPGADSTTGLTLTQNGNSFTLTTAAATTFTGSGGVSQSGTYTLSISDAGGNTATTTATINVTDAPLTLVSIQKSITATEGTPLSAVELALFSDGNPVATASNFKATIDWGDGTTSAGTVAASGGNFQVSGTHTYVQPLTTTIAVTIQDLEGATLFAQTATFSVADATVTAGTAPALVATEGAALNNAVVAQFTDADALAQPSDFAASVTNWGDGSTGTGTIVETSVDGSGAHFNVAASHTYTAPLAVGSITVAIQDLTGTAAATGATSVTVNAGALSITPSSLVATAGSTIPGGTVVGSFTDAGGADPLANYTASVSFPGADATTALNLTQNGNSFTLTTAAAATFVKSGSIQTGSDSVTVNDAGANTAMALGTVQVQPAPLTLVSTNSSLTATEGTPLSAVELALFSDGNPAATASNFKATIDWGDGTTSAGTVAASGGNFQVSGTHTYAKPLTTSISVTIQDVEVGGSTLVAQVGPVTVTDATLTGGTAPALIATVGMALNNVEVAQFTDANAQAQPGDFAATVTNWGDGTVSAGTVVETSVDGAGAHFVVQASHTYSALLAAGSNLSVAIQDLTGTTAATGTTAVTVNARPLAPQENLIQAIYKDELGRSGSVVELDYWLPTLNSAGTTAVAGDIARSEEARDHLVQGWYVAYLGRAAVGGEEQGWVNLLVQGQTEEQVLSDILGSTEFFNNAQSQITSGTAQERFVQDLYQTILDRAGSASDVAYWVGQEAKLGQQGTALAFLTLPEYRADLVSAYYTTLLGRSADSAGLNYWVTSTLDATGIRIGIESSQEFYLHANS